MSHLLRVTLDDLSVAELRSVCRINDLPESFDPQQMRQTLLDYYRTLHNGQARTDQ